MSTGYTFEQEQHILSEIDAMLGVFDSTVPFKEERGNPVDDVLYACAAITGGIHLYNAYRKFGVNSIARLNEAKPGYYKKFVFERNIREGVAMVEYLRKIRRYRYVIVPGKVYASGWLQHHYLLFWKEVLRTKADRIAVKRGWHYSNGQAIEFVFGLQHGLPVLDESGKNLLDPRREIKEFERAINNLGKIGADTASLINSFAEIQIFLRHPVVTKIAAGR